MTIKDMNMKKKYMKPSIVVEVAVLPAIMGDTFITGSHDFGDGTGGTGDGQEFIVNSKYNGFGTFDTFDDEEDY